MKGTLFIAVMFVIRLGIPAFVILTLGEIIRRHSGSIQVGGD